MGENNSNAVQKHPLPADERTISPAEAEAILGELASVFLTRPNGSPAILTRALGERQQQTSADEIFPKPQEMYRVLVEQIPAVVFIAYLDRGIGEAYVSPQIEATLGFSQEEWLQEPIRWYEQVHPEDKQRWSVEAAQMLVTGDPLKSSYRVLARDGRVVWFRCEAKMVRKPDGSPWAV
jgi:PAS domain S-box-containing protein